MEVEDERQEYYVRIRIEVSLQSVEIYNEFWYDLQSDQVEQAENWVVHSLYRAILFRDSSCRDILYRDSTSLFLL